MQWKYLIGCALVVCLSPWRSTADPITIQSGSLTATFAYDSLSISLVGAERGFTFDSGLSILDARFDPFGSLKPVGSSISPGGQWSTNGFVGATATLDGRTFPEGEYRVSGMQLRDPQAFFLLDGPRSGSLPMGVSGDLFTLESPFTFSGFFNYIEDPSLPNRELVWNHNDLIGQGTASLTYVGSGQDSFSWRFRSAVYEFTPAASAAPVPEPGSLLLFGSGLVAVVARIRGRRNSTANARR